MGDQVTMVHGKPQAGNTIRLVVEYEAVENFRMYG